jgi:hypothetical protein
MKPDGYQLGMNLKPLENMKRLLIILFLFAAYTPLLAQKHLILDNQQVIPIKKAKIKDGVVQYKTTSGDKIKTPKEEVVGFYEHGILKDAVYYVVEDQFLKRKVEGKINVYVKSVSTTEFTGLGGENDTTDKTFYIEKDGKVEVLLRPNDVWNSNKLYLPVMEEYVGDDPEALAEIKKPFYVHHEQFLNVIINYNIRNFESSPIPEDVKYGDVIIFRSNEDQNSDPLKVYANGQQYELNSGEKVTIKVRTDDFSKICFEQGFVKYCNIVIGLEDFSKYYMVDAKENIMPSVSRKDKNTMESMTLP